MRAAKCKQMHISLILLLSLKIFSMISNGLGAIRLGWPIYRSIKATFRPFWLTFRPTWHTLPNMNEQTEELSESSRFYRLVQEVTVLLVGARGEEIDAAVDDCLAWMGVYFGVESVSLGGISKSGELTPALRVWGRLPSRGNSLALSPSPGPEMVAQFCREGSFVYGRLEDLDEFP